MLGVLGVPGLIFAMLIGFTVIGDESGNQCMAPGTGSLTIDPDSVPEGPIEGYRGEQLVNAAYIIEAGRALGLGSRDQTIGVMTAMGESSLRILDYGDDVGPDSRGLFQQRDNGAWGTYEDRMDPFISSTNFFKALMKLEERGELEPTIAAHRVQRNADPYHYRPYWSRAVTVVSTLAQTDIGLGEGGCGEWGEVNALGWANPGKGPINSSYGMRFHPIDKVWRLHSGTDLQAGGCDGPIWAAKGGKVVFKGFDGAGNGTIRLDHGEGLETRYLHMERDGMLVEQGDEVKAGQQIARTGSTGKSTACHLHFEVRRYQTPTDPVPFMTSVGITLGQ